MQINECNKRLLNLINMNVEGSSNVSYERLPVEETELKKLSYVTLSSYSYNSKCCIYNITRNL